MVLPKDDAAVPSAAASVASTRLAVPMEEISASVSTNDKLFLKRVLKPWIETLPTNFNKAFMCDDSCYRAILTGSFC